MDNNVVAWFDVPTLDFARAVRFYSEILGAEVKIRDFMGERLGFFPMPADPKGPGAGGDIVPPNERYRPSKGGTRVYLNCAGKLDQVLSRVERAGGRIVQPKVSIGGAGWVAIIEDTEGNLIGLHSPE